MTTSLNLSDLRIGALLSLLALSTGCLGKDGLLTSHEVDESSSGATGDPTDTAAPAESGTDAADETGSTDDTGECETACTPEPALDPCLRGLVASDGLIGLASRKVQEDCVACEAVKVMLVTIDPVTAQQTLLGLGPDNSIGSALTVAGDGSIFVAANKSPTEEQGAPSGLLLKFSPAGELLWQKLTDDQWLFDVAVRGEEVIVVSHEHDLLAFAASDGAPLWDVPSHDGEPGQIEVDAEGALYVAGTEIYPEGDALPSWYLRKYVGEGTLLWDHTSLMAEIDRPYADGLAFDEAGGVVVGVRVDTSAAIPDSIEVYKLSVDGEEVWSRPLPKIVEDVDTDDSLNALISRPGGGVILVGGADNVGYSVALDPDGEPLWQDLQQGEGLAYNDNWGAAVVAGDLLVSGCGFVEGGGAASAEGWLLHLTP